MQRVRRDDRLDSAGFFRTSAALSSQSLGSDGVTAVLYRHPSAELALPTLPEHVVCLYLGRPLQVVERQSGESRERQVTWGETLLGPPGCPGGEVAWNGLAEYLHIRVPAKFLRTVAETLEVRCPEALDTGGEKLFRDPRIAQVGVWLVEEMKDGGLRGQLFAESLVNLLAVQMCRAYAQPARSVATDRQLNAASLRRAIDYVRANIGGKLSLADIAAAAGHSPYQFAKMFRQTAGLPPHQFVIRCRLEEAERLLTASQHSLAMVAELVGFADQSHLSRHFKRFKGLTPAQFRSALRIRTGPGQERSRPSRP